MPASVPLRTKTWYGLGQMAEGVKNSSFNTFLLFYFTAVLGLPGSTAGLALFIALLFDAVTDPVIGSLSDRLHHRFGRRHPFLIAAALPLGVFFALLFSPPEGLGERGLFAWLLVFAVLVRASMTLYHVPHLSLGAELSEDYAERTTIVAWRTVFGLTGAGLAVGAAFLFFFRPAPGFPDGQLNPAVYPPYGVTFGILMVVVILISAWGTWDRIPMLPKPGANAQPAGPGAIFREYALALRNPSFASLFAGVVVFFIMRGIQEVLALHMGTYFWNLSADQIIVIALPALPGAILGIPLWTVAAARIDKKPTFLAGNALFSICVLLPPTAQLLGFFPPQESPSYLVLLTTASFISGIGAGGALVTAGSMMADIADEHELTTGLRQQGIFFGALAFGAKTTSGLGSFLGGLALDAIDFPTQAERGTVPPEIVDALGVLYGPGIALIAVLAFVILSRYRLNGKRHAEIVVELKRRRLRGEAVDPTWPRD